MGRINRRAFLAGSGTLAATPMMGSVGELWPSAPEETLSAEAPQAAASFAPFAWNAAGLELSWEFLDQRLRVRSMLPTGVALPEGMPTPTPSSGLETALLCTGEDADDHHGLKFTGGMPGGRLIFSGREETALRNGRRLVLTQFDPVLRIRVE